MHKLVAALLALTTISAAAQTPAAQPVSATLGGSNWQNVQTLPIGTSIEVTVHTAHANCKLRSVDADTLTCTQGKDVVFQRADITTIKIRRRGRSALIGAAIGAGGGAIVGVTLGRNGSFIGRGAGAVILAVPGALIGAIIGASTDFSRSTVYHAP
jgi:hypothetical protein